MNALLPKLAVTLAAAGILGAVAVYANQGRLDERVKDVEQDTEQCCGEASDATKALIRLETRLGGLEKNQDAILQKLDKLIEAK